MTTASPMPSSRRFDHVVIAAMVVAMTVPFFLSSPLPLADLPNHMARIHIMANIDSDPVLAGYYGIEWDIMPNLGMELFMPWLTALFGIDLVSKIVVALTLFGTVFGVLLINKTLFGHVNAVAFFAFALVFHRILIWGFVNYLIGLMLCFVLFALWIRYGRRHVPLALTLFPLAAVGFFFVHLHALSIYAVVVGSYELGQVIFARPFHLGAACRRLLVGAAQFVAPMLLLLASATSAERGLVVWGSLRDKVIGLLDPFLLYNLPFDLACAGIFFAVFALGIVTRRLTVARAMILPLAVLVVVYLAMPTAIFDSFGADRRLSPAIYLLLCASVRLTRARDERWVAGFVVVPFFAARLLVLAFNWYQSGIVYEQIRDAIAGIGTGARLAVIDVHLEEPYLGNPPLNHIGNIAVIDRQALVNSLLATEGWQVLRVRDRLGPSFYRWNSHEFVVKNRNQP